MRYKGRRQSKNVEDRRGIPAKGKLAGGGIVGILVVVGIVLLQGGDLGNVLQALMQQSSQVAGPSTGHTPTAEENELAEFVSVVLADTEDIWNEQFRQAGLTYREPKLVYFTDRVESACGLADSGVGPFYCGADETIYIDLSFYKQLERDLGAPGDFAQAYVIAHEVGHHVQHLLGYSERVHRARGRVSQQEYNQLSVRLELQADFLAGVWAHHAQRRFNSLEPGDIAEAVQAAEAIGDDTLQRRSHRHVDPHQFTHGTSAQRVAWFKYGYETGDYTLGNTFDDAVFDRVNPR
ncbi:MAG: neutral zinc metallopeptidase [Planctomycetota bacterium]